jgi:hypothetical protein
LYLKKEESAGESYRAVSAIRLLPARRLTKGVKENLFFSISMHIIGEKMGLKMLFSDDGLYCFKLSSHSIKKRKLQLD